MQMTFPYLILRGASYSYRRRIPQYLKQFYSGDFIVQSLKTRDKHAAMIKGEALNTATEKLWDDLILKRRFSLKLRYRLAALALSAASI